MAKKDEKTQEVLVAYMGLEDAVRTIVGVHESVLPQYHNWRLDLWKIEVLRNALRNMRKARGEAILD